MVDNNTRAAMLQTERGDLRLPDPYEQAKVLEGNAKLDVVAAVDPAALHQHERHPKPFDNPKVRRALNYAINKDALKVAFAGYAVPAEACAAGHRLRRPL